MEKPTENQTYNETYQNRCKYKNRHTRYILQVRMHLLSNSIKTSNIINANKNKI